MNIRADEWRIPTQQFWLRGQQPEQPVEFDEERGLWHVYGYPETLAILGDPVTYSSDLTRLFPDSIDNSLREGDPTQQDGTEHRRLRKLASHAFTPKTVADLEPRIDKLTRELLDEIAGTDRIELVSDLAYPLPVTVIAELLGIPNSDLHRFRELVDGMLDSPQQMSMRTEDQHDYLRAQIEPMRQITDYFQEHVTERRKRPRQDLLTELIHAEADGQRLSDNEVVNFATLLLGAGHITTTMLLGNTLLCLDAHPDQAARLRADRSTLNTAIEESLRFLSPVAATYRVTNTEVHIAGRRVPADQMLMVWLAAANRDPRQFAQPDTFDQARHPNAHLGFGRGAHFCLGAPLARLEGRIALNILLDRFPALRTDPDNPPDFMAAPDFTGVKSLPLRTG